MSTNEIESSHLVHAITERLSSTIKDVVPWFVEQMPAPYFRDISTEAREEHLSALIAAKSSDQPVSLTLRSADDAVWTFINDTDRPGLLADLVDRLPPARPLNSAHIYTAEDSQIVIDVFSFRKSKPFDMDAVELQAAYERFVSAMPEFAPHLTEESIRAHCENCRSDYINAVSGKRFFKHLDMYRSVAGTERVTTHVEAVDSVPGYARLMIAAANADPTSLFRRTARYLSSRGIDVRRAYLESMGPPDGTQVSMLSLVVVDSKRDMVNAERPATVALRHDLARLVWLDQRVLKRANEFVSEETSSLTQCEVLVALSDLIHQRIGPLEPYRYSRDRVEDLVFRNCDLSLELSNAVQERSGIGRLDAKAYEQCIHNIHNRAAAAEGGASGRRVLEMLCAAALAIKATNLGVTGRCALGFELDPGFLHGELTDTRSAPYGVLYFYGRMFHGFHVRFRDIARGGLRVVRPRNAEAYLNEINRLYSEAWGLANAQQLKNKDIPEGGAKGVILADPAASTERVVKALGDTLLDLNLSEAQNQNGLIYLGPDENITDELISWLVDQAARRGHPCPNAFMSSKPGAGINHKEFGVTSEGVVVFLEAALKSQGIDPRTQSFTVKMTGGPDGDVAGNAIRIMHREFGPNTQIVGIADGTGSAEDPNGLDLEELLRLVDEGCGIASFNSQYLSAHGRVRTLSDVDGVEARNTLHNRIKADAFIPCGGRPAAVNGNNWRSFLSETETASARVVVEGANLFFTEDARDALSKEAGVLFVKDSSANKCGVICSSYEIAASLLVDEQTFLEIKETFVKDVLEQLRRLARREAMILFSHYRRRPHVPLSKVSSQLSDTINRLKDSVITQLENMDSAQLSKATRLVEEHLPKSLVDAAGAEAIASLPTAYCNRIIASVLASEIVYREGIDGFVDVSEPQLGILAVGYLRQLEKSRRLQALLETEDVSHKDTVLEVLNDCLSLRL